MAKPRLNEKYVRLYGNPICPFVERTRLALASQNISYQFAMMDLNTKNEWHINMNGGTLPLMELTNGHVVPDSKNICIWANDNSTSKINLFPPRRDQVDILTEELMNISNLSVNIFL